VIKADNKLDITRKIITSDVSEIDFRPPYYFAAENKEGIPIDDLHTIQQELISFRNGKFVPLSETAPKTGIYCWKSLILNDCKEIY
jgi:hypothetical protein